MLRFRYIFTFLLLATAIVANGQHAIGDSIIMAFSTKPKAFFGLNNRNTFLHSHVTKLYGFTGGVVYANTLKLYVGVYGFSGKNKKIVINDNRFVQDTVLRYISTYNVALGVEYKYYSKKRWSLSMPVQLGIGGIKYVYKEPQKAQVIRQDGFVLVPFSVGGNAYYRVLPYVYLKMGLGYRLAIGKKEVHRLTSPYYSVGVSIRLAELIKEL